MCIYNSSIPQKSWDRIGLSHEMKYFRQQFVTVHTPLSREVFPHILCGNPEFFSAKSHLFAISVHREACCWSRSEQ